MCAEYGVVGKVIRFRLWVIDLPKKKKKNTLSLEVQGEEGAVKKLRKRMCVMCVPKQLLSKSHCYNKRLTFSDMIRKQ